jgi:hypothetical protein
MDSTTEALTPKFNLFGFVLAVVGGALAAGGMGFLYHLVANKAGFDYIIALAAILGAIVGFVVGRAGRIGGLRAVTLVMLVAFVFGVGGYAARYFFEFNDVVETAVQEVAQEASASGVSLAEVRQFMLDELAQQYPPGGLVGYLQILTESGFSIGSRGSDDSDAPIKGGMAWGLLLIEALAAGGVAAYTARGIVTPKVPAQASVPPSAPPTGQ